MAVAHVAAHDLGAVAYAIRAAVAAAPADEAEAEAEAARLGERDRQRERIPAELRELVLDGQQARSSICWNVFDD